MANLTTARCVWLVDTIRRYGRVTRRQLQEAWLRSRYSDGKPLSRRTFCNHRQAAEELFRINIQCDPKNFEYYIDEDGGNNSSVTDWLLNSISLNNVLADARDATDRIFVENVPSAREYLDKVIEALKTSQELCFDYHPYTRSLPTEGVVIQPYFIKLFKQRWYAVGLNVGEGKVKTYALDRMKNVKVLGVEFTPDPDFDRANYFKDSYGIVVPPTEPRKVVLQVEPRQAKYFRALPLHSSQVETVSDKYSLFTYRIHLTDDFVEEILRYGPRVKVLEPAELRVKVKTILEESLKNYEDQTDSKP